MVSRHGAARLLPDEDRRLGRWTRVLVGLLIFLGLGGVVGGVGMLAAPNGSMIGLDPAFLEPVPLLETWLIPGLFLLFALGVLPLVTAWAVVAAPVLAWAGPLERRTHEHFAWAASLATAVLLVMFIAYEALVITATEARPLQILMAATGIAIGTVASSAPVRADLRC
jgi:hypothetical protein